MKKLFISCPMNGRDEEAITKSMDKMHKLMEAILGEKLEVIETYIDEDAPNNVNAGVWYLSKSIELLAEADYFVGFGFYLSFTEKYKGCEIEAMIADHYDIPIYLISDENIAEEILSDLKEGGKNERTI